jgi:DNA-binding NarL/FixJ family response regulator
MIRVAIADDHPIVRQGLRRIATEGGRIAVTGEAATAWELFHLVAGAPVDVILLDVSMPGSAFVDTVRELREKFPSVRVLVLSVHPEDQWALRALRAGASGYLTKDHSPEQLVDAIHRVARGGKYISESLAGKLAGLVDLDTRPVPHEQLSDREFEVLCSLGCGMTVKDVAAHMHLSAKTVSTYRTRLLEKMGLSTNADLVRYVVEHDLMR